MEERFSLELADADGSRAAAWRSPAAPETRADSDAIVYIVDNDDPVRKSLRWLIEPLEYEVHAFASGDDFLAAFDPFRPACLLLDVRMPGMSGLDLQQELLRRGSGIPILFLSAHADVAMCVHAMKLGAFEFFEKPYNQQALIDGIRSAVRFDRERQARRVRSDIVQARLSLLSQREREVLDLIFDGASNRNIATALRITVRTVEAHRARVMEKMRAESIVSLVRMVCQAAGC